MVNLSIGLSVGLSVCLSVSLVVWRSGSIMGRIIEVTIQQLQEVVRYESNATIEIMTASV